MAAMARIIEDQDGIADVVRRMKRVAVLGMKTEAQRDQAAFYVPAGLMHDGIEIVPVPVYYPEVTQILGLPVYRRVADVPGPIDVVDVFRRSHRLVDHVDDLLKKKPAVVWFQSDIENDDVAQQLVNGGIDVIQDSCLLVMHRLYRGR